MSFNMLDELTLDLLRAAAIRHDIERENNVSHFSQELSIFTRLSALGLALGHTFNAALNKPNNEVDLTRLVSQLTELSTTAAIWIDVINRCTCRDTTPSHCFRHRGSKPETEEVPLYHVGTPVVVTDECTDETLRGLTGKIRFISTRGTIVYYVIFDIDDTTLPLRENEIRSTIPTASPKKPDGCTCYDVRGIGEENPHLIPSLHFCPVHNQKPEGE